MLGEYITQRLLPEFVSQACQELGFTCQSFSDDWVHKIANSQQTRFVMGYKFDINSSAAANIASDKVATYQVLVACDVPALPHYLVRTKVTQHTVPDQLLTGDVVVKPLSGTSGHGVYRSGSIDNFATISKLGKEHNTSATASWSIDTMIMTTRLNGLLR